MSVLGTVLWIAGIAMILGGIALAQDSPVGMVVALAGLLLVVLAARRDYDSSRTPVAFRRR